ncbi:stage II sporulation protein R [Alteribacillus persepolensis]|uniref:Stage II sporulation protein R n=1 Tax=Alteribacillus persepolensis TaxID=568899 RepID=A0A1G8HDD0_9BACI|nr:stage II sporulation protein R [Alteribacillus persepolensis]SDI04500.1 stage II sporulation protein R [Alteribacillus persepolensis]
MKNKALIYVIFLVLIAWLHMEQQQNASASNPSIDTIPEEAIRLRILAHDDSPKEQLLKREVRDAVNAEVRQLMEGVTEKEEARGVMEANVDAIEKVVRNVIADHHLSHTFTIGLKEQVEFPTRIYGPLVYPAGEYEALVVSIGEGKGENWWCVLFPPLCFLSANEEEDVENNTEPVENIDAEEGFVDKNDDSVENEKEYSFFIVEKWNKWFGKS